jgi:hypothetical protein
MLRVQAHVPSLRAVRFRLIVYAMITGLSFSSMTRAQRGPGSSGIRSARVETQHYIADIVAAGPYRAGAESAVKVTLVAKGGYHMNAQYPYKFKTAAAAEGLNYLKPVLGREDGTFEETRATFQVRFVASHAGSAIVGGTLHLSVCSPTNCVVDKAPLEISLEVK